MFNRIGQKIKTLATITTICGMIGSCLVGLALAFFNLLIGIIIAACGCLLAWIGAFLLYAFGELVDNSAIAAHLLRELKSMVCTHEKSVPSSKSEAAVYSIAVPAADYREGIIQLQTMLNQGIITADEFHQLRQAMIQPLKSLSGTPAEQLEQLEQLFSENKISEEEYNKMRDHLVSISLTR